MINTKEFQRSHSYHLEFNLVKYSSNAFFYKHTYEAFPRGLLSELVKSWSLAESLLQIGGVHEFGFAGKINELREGIHHSNLQSPESKGSRPSNPSTLTPMMIRAFTIEQPKHFIGKVIVGPSK